MKSVKMDNHKYDSFGESGKLPASTAGLEALLNKPLYRIQKELWVNSYIPIKMEHEKLIIKGVHFYNIFRKRRLIKLAKHGWNIYELINSLVYKTADYIADK